MACAPPETSVLTTPTTTTSAPLPEAAQQQQLQPEQPLAQPAAAAGDKPPEQQPQQEFVTVKQLRLKSAAAYLPHPEKEAYGGEDAHFVSNMAGGALGVADGVGGWAESGVNPAEYSRMLMRVACAYIEGADVVACASLDPARASSPCASLHSCSYDGAFSSLDGGSSSGSDGSGFAGRDPAAAVAVVDPRGALDTAHKLTKLPGSATACVVQLCPEQRSLLAANLGDSGFVVVRSGSIVARSSPKQHYFDCPLQFGAFPEHVEETDTADDAELLCLPVQPGDMIVAGSDGLWDNMYPTQLLQLLAPAAAGGGSVDAAADAIAAAARANAADESFASPYSQEAKAQGYDWPWWMKVANTRLKDGKVQLGELTGGKMDDVTVLVAVVEEADVQLPLPASSASASASAAASSSTASSSSNGSAGGVAAAAAAAGGAQQHQYVSNGDGTYSRMQPQPATSNGTAAAAAPPAPVVVVADDGSGGGAGVAAKAAAAAAVGATILAAAVQSGV